MELKIPASYMPKPGKSSSNEPATFERYIITEWKKAKGKKAERQAVIDKAYENERMSSYEYIIACLSLEK